MSPPEAANDVVLLNHGDGQTAFDGAENVTPMPCIDVYALYLYVTETLNGSFDKYSVSDNRITIK